MPFYFPALLMKKQWRTSRRQIDFSSKILVMGIINVTPDSFSDGGQHFSVENALKRAERMIEEGADILDIGGESTRPQSERISEKEELRRTLPVVKAIASRFDIPISIDTTKSLVAEKAVESGVEIVNDISGLRFDNRIAALTSKYRTGLILMHSRGDFAEMHKQKPVENVLSEVSNGLRKSIETAIGFGVKKEQIALDVGIGFGKTQEQNLELIAKLETLCFDFAEFPMLVGTSRKSFLGKILGEAPPSERIAASLASTAIAVWNGAQIVRVHDVKETLEVVKVVQAIKAAYNNAES